MRRSRIGPGLIELTGPLEMDVVHGVAGYDITQTSMKPLNRTGASMYLSEIRELTDSLIYRLELLRTARANWLEHNNIAASQAGLPAADFDLETFSVALNHATHEQGDIFEAFESLFAAWARLSLLLHPITQQTAVGEWREKRGQMIREVLELPADTLLANRSFRDSWMHFDERIDQAYLGGWLGNRQQFVKTAGVAVAIAHSIRVIDVEMLAFHYRNRDGNNERVMGDQMYKCLLQVRRGLGGVGFRILSVFPAV